MSDAISTLAQQTTGHAEVAAVMNALDEDGEDGEEAEVPHEFEYFSDEERED